MSRASLSSGLLAPSWLPAWEEWYSGLMPYPLLLPVQLLLVAGMAVINHQNATRRGRFNVESPRARRWLRTLATIYFGAMVLRYVLTMVMTPEMRWPHGTIPIVFHCVLAGYLAVLGLAVEAPANRRAL